MKSAKEQQKEAGLTGDISPNLQRQIEIAEEIENTKTDEDDIYFCVMGAAIGIDPDGEDKDNKQICLNSFIKGDILKVSDSLYNTMLQSEAFTAVVLKAAARYMSRHMLGK